MVYRFKLAHGVRATKFSVPQPEIGMRTRPYEFTPGSVFETDDLRVANFWRGWHELVEEILEPAPAPAPAPVAEKVEPEKAPSPAKKAPEPEPEPEPAEPKKAEPEPAEPAPKKTQSRSRDLTPEEAEKIHRMTPDELRALVPQLGLVAPDGATKRDLIKLLTEKVG